MDATLAKLRAQHPVSALVHLDVESFYSADYSLSKLTTEAYVRDPRFEVIGVGVRLGNAPSVWLEEWDFRKWAARVDWSRVAVNAHHAQFDGLVLSHHFGIRPSRWFCTLSMGRALTGIAGLNDLAEFYGLGAKTDGLAETKGKRRADMTQAEWLKFGAYCRNDVDLTAALLARMRPEFPKAELWLVDTTIRMFTEPVFEGDRDVLDAALVDEEQKKRETIARIVEFAGKDPDLKPPGPRSRKPPPTPEEIAKKVLGSSDKFAALLVSLGESPPTKYNDAGGKIYAFAKDDPGMAELLESPREEIRQLAEARLSVKSSIDITRTERMIGMARRGRIPIYLKAYGAHTNRWSGGDKFNPQNFRRGGKLRAALLAPENLP